MTDRPDVLIQNVSAQCIPNLVALKTFAPKKVVWVFTPEFSDQLNRLRQAASLSGLEQQNWRVDARDAESMHRILNEKFAGLPGGATVYYHLTCGTKSMALQGLFNLGTYRRENIAEVKGIVMDPRSQHFDVVYPEPKNNAYPCEELALEAILNVHGNALDMNRPMRSVQACLAHKSEIERLRQMAMAIKNEWSGCDWVKLHGEGATLHRYKFHRKGRLIQIGAVTRQALQLTEGLGLAENLSFRNPSEISYRPRTGSLIEYIKGDWLEDWVAAVLSGLDWNGTAGASANVLIGRKKRDGVTDEQEADFLGARRNHLVYWSCKHTKELSQPQLFEVDAMRDELGGRDFHVSGIVHTGEVSPTMHVKAARMGLKVIRAMEPDAAEQLVKASGG